MLQPSRSLASRQVSAAGASIARAHHAGDKGEQHAKKMQHQKSLMERKDADLHDVQQPTQCLTLSSSMTMASPLFRM